MSRDVAIRPARASDAAAIVALIRKSFDPARLSTTIYGCAGIAAFVGDQIEAPAGRADRRFTVAVDPELVGCADWSLDAQGVFLGYVAVDAARRCAGVGCRLLRALLESAPLAGDATFRLDVYDDNVPARVWYEGLGMRVAGASDVWELAFPRGADPAPAASVSGWPQATASCARFGFGAVALVHEGASFAVGLLGERWLRVVDPNLLERPRALAALAELAPERRILAILPGDSALGACAEGARRIARTLRMEAAVSQVRQRLRTPPLS